VRLGRFENARSPISGVAFGKEQIQAVLISAGRLLLMKSVIAREEIHVGIGIAPSKSRTFPVRPIVIAIRIDAKIIWYTLFTLSGRHAMNQS
jgi:hypothetical protein